MINRYEMSFRLRFSFGKRKHRDFVLFNKVNVFPEFCTYQPGTSSGSSQLPVPSASPILNTVPMGQPYSLACPSRQM